VGQTGAQTYYIYTDKHNIRANGGPVRFYGRQNAVEIALGNDEQYPLKAPLWFGFITDRWYFNNDDNLQGFEGFWLTRNVIAKPDDSSITLADAGVGTLADDAWYFKVSYVYDGYQESPLSEFFSLNPAGTNAIDITISIPYASSDPTVRPSTFGALFNKRITHVRIYVAKGITGDAKDDYFLIHERAISSIHIGEDAPGTTFWSASTNYFAFPNAVRLDDDLWNAVTYLKTSGSVLGKLLRWDINQGHKAQRVDANFKFRSTLEEQHYKAPIYTDEKRDAFVAYSVAAEKRGTGVPADDVIPHENFLNLDQKGIVEVTGLATIRGFLVILTPNKIFVYAPGRSLTDFPVERGNIAESGFIEVDNVVYFSASDDFYAFDGVNAPTKLMFGKILDQWKDISTANKQSAFVGYSRKTDSLYLVAGGTIFIYDRLFDSWRTYATDQTFIGFTTSKDGRIFGATTSNIYELQSDSFTETVTIDWESPVIDFVKEQGGVKIPTNARIDSIALKHKGDKKIKVSLFDPGVSETYPKEVLTFFAKNNSRPDVKDDISFEARQIKVKIEDVDPGTSQPENEIDYLKINYEPLE
jgi:hypothetical protein